MAVKQTKGAVVVRKKSWTPVIAPALFNNQQIGELYLEEPAQAIGRKISVSLMTLTGDPQKQSITITFKITGTENSRLQTELIGYSITPTAVRKMMRRGRNRLEDSFVVKTQDGIPLRVKPSLVTRSKHTSGVLANLHRQTRAFILKRIAKLAFADLAKELIVHKFQRDLQQALHKIAPLQSCELKDVHVETSEKGLKSIITAPKEQAAPQEQPTAEQAETTEMA